MMDEFFYYVLTAPDGTETRLRQGENLVGRFSHCEVIVEDARVAGEHCRIVVTGGNAAVAALGDAGLVVDGKPVGEDPVDIRPRSVLLLGGLRLTFGRVEKTGRVRVAGWYRRARRAILWAAGLLLLSALVLALAAPLIFNEERIRRRIVECIEGSLHRQVTVGDIDVKLLKARVEITDLHIANKADFTPTPMVRVPSCSVKVSPWRYIFSLGSRLHARVTVVEPEIFVERNSTGRTNVKDVLTSLFETGLARALVHRDSIGTDVGYSDLKVRLRVRDAIVRFRDDLKGANTEVRHIGLSADLDSMDSPFRYELVLKAPLGDRKGEVRLSGEPRLFARGRIGPHTVRGKVALLTVEDFDPSTFLRHAGLEGLFESLSGEIEFTAEGLGALAHKGSLSVEGLRASRLGMAPAGAPPVGLRLRSRGTTDLPGRKHEFGPLALDSPFGTVEVEGRAVAGLGEGTDLAFRYASSLAQFTSGELGRSLGLREGLSGDLSLEVALRGGARDLAVAVDAEANGLRPEGAVDADEGRALAEFRIAFAEDGSVESLRLSHLDGTMPGLTVSVDPGSVVGLAPGALPTDVSGTARIDLERLTGRYGPALGLGVVRERLAAVLSAEGEKGSIRLQGTLVSRRADAEDPDPLRLVCNATVGLAGRPEVDLSAELRSAVGEYLDGRLTAKVEQVDAGTETTVKLTGTARLGRLLQRLGPLGAGLTHLRPSGMAEVDLVSLKLTPDGIESQGSIKVVDLEIEGPGGAFEEGLAECIFNLKRSRDGSVELRGFRLAGPTGRVSLTGRADGGRLSKASGDLAAAVNVKRLAELLRSLDVISSDLRLTGSVEAEASVDLAAGAVKMSRLSVDTPPLEATGSAEVRRDPEGGAPESSLRLKGEVRPEHLLEALGAGKDSAFRGSGAVSFEAGLVGKGGLFEYEFSSEAKEADLAVGELARKSAGTPASLAAAGRLRIEGELRDSSVTVGSARLSVGSGERAVGADVELWADREGGIEARALAEDVPAGGVARLIPAARSLSPAGRIDLALRARAPLEGLGTEAWLEKLLVDGWVATESLELSHADLPAFLLRLSGGVDLSPRSIEGRGIDVELVSRASARRNTLSVEEIGLSARPGRTLVADLGHLSGGLKCSAAAVDLDEILRSLAGPARPGRAKRLEALSGLDVTGSLGARTWRWGRHQAKDVSCRLELAGGEIRLGDLSGDAYGGRLSGGVTIELDEPGPLHRGRIALDGASLGEITRAGGAGTGVVECSGGLGLEWTGRGPIGRGSLAAWDLKIASESSAGSLAWEAVVPLAAGMRGIAAALGAERPAPGRRVELAPAKLVVTLRQGIYIMPPGRIDLGAAGAYEVSGRMDLAGKLDGRLKLVSLPEGWEHPAGDEWTAAVRSLVESGGLVALVCGTLGEPEVGPPAPSASVAARAALSQGPGWAAANREALGRAGLAGDAARRLLGGRPEILRALGVDGP